MTAPLNRGTDPVSQRVYALILNGITRAVGSTAWVPLAERERLADAVYAELREGGIEVRIADGLAVLRDVNGRLAEVDFHDSVCTGPGVPEGFTCSHPSHQARLAAQNDTEVS